MVRFCILLLLPVLVSFAPPRRIPDPLRYENASGDVFLITAWHRGADQIFIGLREEGAQYEFLSGQADRKRGNRYVFRNKETSLTVRVSRRKITLSRIDFPDYEPFEGTYERVEIH